MKIPLNIYLSVIAFVWFGYVAGISFLEAPLKFQAPDISLPLGLGIGRIVFGTLNKVEWVFLVGSVFIAFIDKSSTLLRVLISLLCSLLLLQTFWLLPYLDARAELIIGGEKPPSSSLHLVYIFLEVVKLILLFSIGIKNLKTAFKFQSS